MLQFHSVTDPAEVCQSCCDWGRGLSLVATAAFPLLPLKLPLSLKPNDQKIDNSAVKFEPGAWRRRWEHKWGAKGGWTTCTKRALKPVFTVLAKQSVFYWDVVGPHLHIRAFIFSMVVVSVKIRVFLYWTCAPSPASLQQHQRLDSLHLIDDNKRPLNLSVLLPAGNGWNGWNSFPHWRWAAADWAAGKFSSFILHVYMTRTHAHTHAQSVNLFISVMEF